MIHAYNEQFLDIIQRKVSAMFELAVLEEHIEIDTFAQKFLSSPVCRALETADPVYALGKSANELLAGLFSSKRFLMVSAFPVLSKWCLAPR